MIARSALIRAAMLEQSQRSAILETKLERFLKYPVWECHEKLRPISQGLSLSLIVLRYVMMLLMPDVRCGTENW